MPPGTSPNNTVVLSPDAAAEIAASYARLSLAPATLRAYRADWDDFLGWCRRTGRVALPAVAETLAAYLASLAATHSRAALERRLAAIGAAHRLKQLPWRVEAQVRHTLRGIHRQHGTPARQAAALTTPEIRKLLATCDDGLTGLRDRALLLIGYAGALRRAELVAIEREHISVTPDGLRLMIPRSKSDAEGQGAEIGIPRGEKRETCPVRSLQAWLEASRCGHGPVFRKVDKWGGIDDRALNPNAVRQILLRRAEKAGVADEAIMAHTRHRDHKTMSRYVRRARLMTESPAKKLGL